MYYKDDTHYFVMTAKKQCLLRLGVLRQVRPGPHREGLGRGPWEVEARPGPSLPLLPPWVWSEPILCLCQDLPSTSTSSSPQGLIWQTESYSRLNIIPGTGLQT